jgi:hypothetical protein
MATLYRQTNKTVELFEVPDDKLDAYRLSTITAQKESVNREHFDLYRMEYERSALRYDDLYKAAWTNFSYIALVAGAILTFGREGFMTEVSIFLATIPLLFWWIATFEPLNRYGDQVQMRAACIERLLNELVGITPATPISGQEDKRQIGVAFIENLLNKLFGCTTQTYLCEKGLRHFQEFEKRHFTIQWTKLIVTGLFWIVLHWIVLQSLFGQSNPAVWIWIFLAIVILIWLVLQYCTEKKFGHILRVRFIVRTFAGAIMLVAVCSAYKAYWRHKPPNNEPYVRSSSSKSDSKLPERLNIKIEQ